MPTRSVAERTRADAAARSWRHNLPHERRRASTLRGTYVFLRAALAYLALYAGMFLLPYPWLQLVACFTLPWAIGALFVIGHDAAHGSLVASYRGNHVLGRLAMLPAYHPFTSWIYAHNTLHHGGTCLKTTHPDFPPLSKEEYDALPGWRRLLYRNYRQPWGIGLCYLCDFYLGYLLLPRPEHRAPQRRTFEADRLLVLAFFALQMGVGYWLAGFVEVPILPRGLHAVAAAFVPWLIWLTFMGIASFVQHTHPRTAWYADEREWSFYHVQLRSSTHMVLPWPIGSLLHNIMDHPAHHIDPTIPLYELPAGQKLLEEHAPDDSVVAPLTFGELLRICRVCKLYDYRRHAWTDFAGNPTTPTGLHGLDLLEPVRPSPSSTE
jgi:omega-6 fatty acid desaturase (delta-12 desaturase)